VSQDPHLLYQQTVADNLALAATGARLSRKELARRCDGVYDLFPSLGRLRSAYAAQLSGGERRMLGVGKALIRAPRLLVLDEPSIGLAPATVDAMGAAIASLNRDGLTVLVAEQNARWVLPLADSKYVLDLGTLHRLETTGRQDEDELRLVERYLGAVVAEG
jgi:branched-chain amino acid transport system ATP-binding protein